MPPRGAEVHAGSERSSQSARSPARRPAEAAARQQRSGAPPAAFRPAEMPGRRQRVGQPGRSACAADARESAPHPAGRPMPPACPWHRTGRRTVPPAHWPAPAGAARQSRPRRAGASPPANDRGHAVEPAHRRAHVELHIGRGAIGHRGQRRPAASKPRSSSSRRWPIPAATSMHHGRDQEPVRYAAPERWCPAHVGGVFKPGGAASQPRAMSQVRAWHARVHSHAVFLLGWGGGRSRPSAASDMTGRRRPARQHPAIVAQPDARPPLSLRPRVPARGTTSQGCKALDFICRSLYGYRLKRHVRPARDGATTSQSCAPVARPAAIVYGCPIMTTSEPAAPLPMPRVLLIEDDAAVAETIRRFLERSGMRTAWAPTGKRGMELKKTFMPDVVLVDLGLPDTNGVSLIGWLWQEQRLRHHRRLRPRRGDRAGGRPGTRGRRLHRQAGAAARNGGAHPRGAPAHQRRALAAGSRAGGGGAPCRAVQGGPAAPPGARRRRPAGGADRGRVRRPAHPAGVGRRAGFARAPVRGRAAAALAAGGAQHRPADLQPAPQAGRRRPRAAADPVGARRRLRAGCATAPRRLPDPT